MTNNERVLIEQMRKRGCSYHEIALMTNHTYGAIKAYCSRHQLGVKLFQAQSRNGIVVDTCNQCGKRIRQQPGRKHKRFCCDDCRMQWWTKYRQEQRQNKKANNIEKGKEPLRTTATVIRNDSDTIDSAHESTGMPMMNSQQFLSEFIYYLCRVILSRMIKQRILNDADSVIALSILIDVLLPPISSLNP